MRESGGLLVQCIVAAALVMHGFAVLSVLGMWWAEAFDHLMVHAAVLSALGAVLAGLRRAWGPMAGLSLLFLVDLVRWWPAPPPNPEGGETVTVLFANVLGHNPGRRALLDLIDDVDPDVIGLVEVTPSWARSLDALGQRYPHRLVEARSDAFGVALYSRHPLEDLELVYLAGEPLPSVAARWPGGPRILVTHPPPPVSAQTAKMRRAQLGALDAWMAKSAGHFLAMGDLNCAPWAVSFPRTPARGAMRIGTWSGPMGLPLDHVLVGTEVGLDDVRLGSAIGSDHRPVVATIRIGTRTPMRPDPE